MNMIKKRKKLRLKIRKTFLALANGKYMWSGHLQLQLSSSLTSSQCLGQNNNFLEKLSSASQPPLTLFLAFIFCPIPWCLLFLTPSLVFNLQSFSPCALPKSLKLSSILIVLSITHIQFLNLYLRLLQYTPDRSTFKTSFWTLFPEYPEVLMTYNACLYLKLKLIKPQIKTTTTTIKPLEGLFKQLI